MATIRATCSDCGDVELTTGDVRVRVCLEDSAATYQFRCPACHMSIVKPAEPRIVDLLAASGVEVFMWRLPAELYEPHLGPRIDHDDLLDFHELLQCDSWYEDLEQLVESQPETALHADLDVEPEFDTER